MTPPPTFARPAFVPDAEGARFLREMLPQQPQKVARHRLPDGRHVWLKKASATHGAWRYALQGGIARALGLQLMRPVPKPGGAAAIAQESARLVELQALGLRVPELLATQPEGLLMTDLSAGHEPVTSLGDELARAARQGAAALLPPWREGLHTVAVFHAQGTVLSQAFARNMVRGPDGVIGCLDFEDDPRLTLSAAECRARDWLSYLHGTAQLLREADAIDGAAALLRALRGQLQTDTLLSLRHLAVRTAWLRHLPQGRRWGRDVQRLSALAELFAQSGLSARAGLQPA